MTTIRDVAKQAGVGLGTVSRVLNDSPLVSDATRQRVLKVIEELQYTPNPMARRLSLGKAQTIAVIAPFFTRPSCVERLRGIENTVAESEYDLIIYNVETPERRDRCFRDVPRPERVDGVLVISLNPRDQDIPKLMEARVPLVWIDTHHPGLASFPRVTVDDVLGGKMATEHLIQLNHRRIGFIGDRIEERFCFTSSHDRFLGYREAIREAGLPFEPACHGEARHGRYAARHMAREMLSLPDRPTAIFAASDTQAFGVLEAARDMGINVPSELSVVGYDDIEMAEFVGLTTVRQMLYESGGRGVQLLLEILQRPSTDSTCEMLPTELLVRRTTARPRD